MSDSFFVATAARAHNLWSTSHRAAKVDSRDLSHDDKSEKHDGSTAAKRPSALGMMVSLDHTIYFHRPGEVRADDWLYREMESPWAGEGRGLALERIWSKEGRLWASGVKEVGIHGHLMFFFSFFPSFLFPFVRKGSMTDVHLGPCEAKAR